MRRWLPHWGLEDAYSRSRCCSSNPGWDERRPDLEDACQDAWSSSSPGQDRPEDRFCSALEAWSTWASSGRQWLAGRQASSGRQGCVLPGTPGTPWDTAGLPCIQCSGHEALSGFQRRHACESGALSSRQGFVHTLQFHHPLPARSHQCVNQQSIEDPKRRDESTESAVRPSTRKTTALLAATIPVPCHRGDKHGSFQHASSNPHSLLAHILFIHSPIGSLSRVPYLYGSNQLGPAQRSAGLKRRSRIKHTTQLTNSLRDCTRTEAIVRSFPVAF